MKMGLPVYSPERGKKYEARTEGVSDLLEPKKKQETVKHVFVPGQFVDGLSPNHPTKRCLSITIE